MILYQQIRYFLKTASGQEEQMSIISFVLSFLLFVFAVYVGGVIMTSSVPEKYKRVAVVLVGWVMIASGTLLFVALPLASIAHFFDK